MSRDRCELSFAQEIKGFLDFFVRGGLVEANVADVFLVVLHQANQFGVVVAGDGHTAVVFTDELHGLAYFFCRKTTFHNAQVKFADEAESDSVAVEDGCWVLDGK